ncbi:MAG: putative protein YbfE [Candidatus Erwinia impunctatus]|nr:putative protein YbfE [Culicoides impunctatus]
MVRQLCSAPCYPLSMVSTAGFQRRLMRNHPHRNLIKTFNMAKENTDRTTLDLFAADRRPGRPKTSPLTRDEQLRINKRNQLKRDKGRGLKRVELKINSDVVEALDQLAESRCLSRGDLIEEMILAQLALLPR